MRAARQALIVLATCASLLPVAAIGAAAEDVTLLDAAERSYENLEFNEAAALYEQTLAAGRLERTQLLRAYVGLALSNSVMLRKERAIWAFKRALALEPGWQLPAYAGPKLAQPLEEARAWWKHRPPPSLRTSQEPEVSAGEAVVVRVELRSDPLELVRRLRLKWTLGAATGEERSAISKKMRLTVPASLVCCSGTLELTVEALDEQGSVVLEAPTSTVSVRSAPPAPAAPGLGVAPSVAASREAEARLKTKPKPSIAASPEIEAVNPDKPGKAAALPLLHAYAAVFGLFPEPSVGGEIGMGVFLGPYFDVAAAVTLGSNIGAQLNVTLHPNRVGRVLRPFVQLRGNVGPLPTGTAFGGGLCLGGLLDLGPGRVIAGIAAEGYHAPVGYGAYAIVMLAGYQFDVL